MPSIRQNLFGLCYTKSKTNIDSSFAEYLCQRLSYHEIDIHKK